MWQLRLFGGFGLEGAHSLTGRAAQRKRQALLALLGSGPHRQISRDKVVALLWPESDSERARHLLASSLYDLRQVLGDDAILATGDDLRLNPERITSDVREFDAAIERQDYATAASLRTGIFLDGFHVAGAAEFERWVDGERERLDQLQAHAFERLAAQCSETGDDAGAARWLQQLAGQQPYNSRIALLYMQALDKSGDAAGAIRYSRTHELLRQQEFGVGADEQIAAFVAELRARPAPPPPAVVPAAQLPKEVSPQSADAPLPAHSRKLVVRWWALGGTAVAALVVAVFALNAPARARDPSIAVLPFKSLGGGEENAYFTEGIHDDLLTQLAKFPDLKVISRTSVMQYRDTEVPMREIGRALGVAVVLEGSVRRVGNRIRVAAQLIDARTDQHLWADTYDRELTDVFAIQSEIARDIARVLHADLNADEKASSVTVPTAVTEAYDHYLRARNLAYSNPVQQIDYPLVQQLLERAVQLDPQFALPFAELTRMHAGMHWTGIDASNARAAAAARALEQAVRLRPGAAETHLAAGYFYYWVRHDYRRALQELEQAHAQLPGSAEVLHVMGLVQRRLSELDAAIESFSNAAQRDPARSLSFTYLAESLAALGRFEEANRAYQSALARSPTDGYTLITYGSMHAAWRGTIDTMRATTARLLPSARTLGGIPGVRFRLAMLERDCAAAAAAMDGAPEVLGLQHAIRPRALFTGWAAECSGQRERARAHFREAERVTRALLAKEGAHPALNLMLGHALVGQDKMNEGIAAARRALELIPYEADAVFGGFNAIEMAAIFTRAHRHDEAVALLQEFCGKPFGIWPAELRLDPRWDALRALPRFRALTRSCT